MKLVIKNSFTIDVNNISEHQLGGTFAPIQRAYRDNFTVNKGSWVSQDKYPLHLADVNGDGRDDIVGFGKNAVYVSLSKFPYGDDIIDKGEGNDIIYGDNNDDLLNGGFYHDQLYEGNGNDTFYGGAGDDTWQGGLGNDRYNGGASKNTLIISPGMGLDIIQRFKDGTDTIKLERGIGFADLDIVSRDNSTLVKVTVTEEILARISGIDVSLIDKTDFIV
ncbi:hypothetical protein VV11_020525 [Trichodesmium erythraeum 21-75]|nr:hypothetical protein [Trichodesmium erythraeum 21-75]